MLRSMYSGISGLKGFQTKLDVIGNNVANVNTAGFKKSRVTFSDTINQTLSGATASTDNKGGTNSKQVGLGSTVAAIDTIHTQSSLQTTGRDLDLAISGDGYFVMKNGDADYFSRAGNFYLDENGTLVNSEGLKVQGYPADENGNVNVNGGYGDISIDVNDVLQNADGTEAKLESFNIGSSGEINGVYSNGSIVTLGQLALAKFSNSSGLTKAGGNTFQQSISSGAPNTGVAGDGRGTIAAGSLEMSNVDLSEEFTDMIVAQRGFQSNTKIITTSDEILQELVNLKR
ncbi:flagellar basal body rod protein FlgG [Bacillus massiliglaciei]|uniref:flagellar basal body rod protein FlgG n=1 Tax=Bacillus massiliglaciei TaxID=1816693 RepID=UPI000B2111C1|nr:flagellar basal body rod protein FlgG [Bacillus massiliglaciei]